MITSQSCIRTYQVVEVVLDWDDTLGCKLLDLLGTVCLPVVDVGVVAHSQWSSSEDDGSHVVVEARSADSLLVSGWGTSFLLLLISI